MVAKKPLPDPPTEHSSLLPSPAPPPYSELAQDQLQTSTSSSTPPSAPSPAPATTFLRAPSPSPSRPRPSHPAGPTAFHALPPPTTSTYAHQRALAEADRRARRRICAALCWGFVIYVAAGMLVGGILGEEWSRGVGRERRKGEREDGREPAGREGGYEAGYSRVEVAAKRGEGARQVPSLEPPTAAPVSVGGELFATI
ncbi:hypothetical protein JCM21900_001599 [Sporobolomyces salmonicolor]